MVLYKIMFRLNGTKRYYNFDPTVNPRAKPKYSKMDTYEKALKVKKELKMTYPMREFLIKRKK